MFESKGKRYELVNTGRTQEVINDIKQAYQTLQNERQKRVDALDDKDNMVIMMAENINSWYCAMDFLPKPSYLPDNVELPKSIPISMTNAIFHRKITRFKVENISDVTELITVYELEEIAFNEALFILLGFDPNIIDYNYWHNADWLVDKMPQYKGSRPRGQSIFNEFTVNLTSVDNCLLDTIESVSLLNKFKNQGDKIPTQEFLVWAVNEGFLKINNKNPKDQETNIPLTRLAIYQETLPPFLKELLKPISIRGLSQNSDELSEGRYTEQNKENLGVGSATVRKDLSKLFKTQWWNNQSQEIKEKIATTQPKR